MIRSIEQGYIIKRYGQRVLLLNLLDRFFLAIRVNPAGLNLELPARPVSPLRATPLQRDPANSGWARRQGSPGRHQGNAHV